MALSLADRALAESKGEEEEAGKFGSAGRGGIWGGHVVGWKKQTQLTPVTGVRYC